MNKINSNEIESINHSDIKSLEDYLQYKRQHPEYVKKYMPEIYNL